jgi:hypothetical protein
MSSGSLTQSLHRRGTGLYCASRDGVNRNGWLEGLGVP